MDQLSLGVIARSRKEHERRLAEAIVSNVRWTVRQIRATPEGKARAAEGVMKIVGAVYDLESGRINFLPDQ